MGVMNLKLKFDVPVQVGEIDPFLLETVTRPRKAKILSVDEGGVAKVRARFFDSDHASEWFNELVDGEYPFDIVHPSVDDGTIEDVEVQVNLFNKWYKE